MDESRPGRFILKPMMPQHSFRPEAMLLKMHDARLPLLSAFGADAGLAAGIIVVSDDRNATLPTLWRPDAACRQGRAGWMDEIAVHALRPFGLLERDVVRFARL